MGLISLTLVFCQNLFKIHSVVIEVLSFLCLVLTAIFSNGRLKPEFRGERCRTCPPLHSHPHKKVMIISGGRNKCGNFIESTCIFSFVA